MKKSFFVMIVFIAIIFTGCTSPIKEDLLSFNNSKLAPITNLEKEALTEYQSIVTKDNYSYKELYTKLKDTIIPKYAKFVEKLAEITVKTDEVRYLHSLYISGAKKQLEALISLKEGIEEKSSEKIDKTNQLLKESKDYMNKYNEEALKLADKYGVDYKLK